MKYDCPFKLHSYGAQIKSNALTQYFLIFFHYHPPKSFYRQLDRAGWFLELRKTNEFPGYKEQKQ